MPHVESLHSARTHILDLDEPKDKLMIVLSGWAMRCRYTVDGGRQIVHILLPGDVLTPDAFVHNHNDSQVTAISDCRIRAYDKRIMHELLVDLPELAAGMWWSATQEEGMLREHVVRLGRRSAQIRLAHMLLELHRRLLAVSEANANTMELPMTQADLADSLGLSPVHVNRSLRALQKQDFLTYNGDSVTIIDRDALVELSDFDPSHLLLHGDVSDSTFHQTDG